MLIRTATASDLAKIRDLLKAAQLSAEGIENLQCNFAIGIVNHRIICVAGYEQYGSLALFRSVAVKDNCRGLGCANEICNFAEAWATQNGVSHFYLLTESAEGLFANRGFVTINRAAAPDAIKATSQFSALCPDTATLMSRTAYPIPG